MRIYFGHSKDFDYRKEYYTPIEENERLQQETIIFPHKENINGNQTREFYTNLDLFIAEVSYPAIGLGIELGWAYDDNIPIYCFYKKGIKPSRSLKCITTNLIEYSSLEELSDNIEQIVIELEKSNIKKLIK